MPQLKVFKIPPDMGDLYCAVCDEPAVSIVAENVPGGNMAPLCQEHLEGLFGPAQTDAAA